MSEVHTFTVMRKSDNHTFRALMRLEKDRVRIQLDSWCVWLSDRQFAQLYEIPLHYQQIIAQHYRRILYDAQHVGIAHD